MRRGAACCAPTPQSISGWSAFASIAFHERRGVAVLRIASGVEQLLYLPGPAVVGEQRQPQLRFRIAVVTLQQIAQVAEPETQVGAAVVQLLRREPRLVQPRGARQDLGVPDRPYLALGLRVEVRLDFHEPEGERRIDPFGQGDVRSEEHTSELQSLAYLVCRLLLEKKNKAARGGACHPDP